MKYTLNGNNNGTSSSLKQQKQEPARIISPLPPEAGQGENQLAFQSPDGAILRGTPIRVSRYSVSFEKLNLGVVPKLSESLKNFTIILRGKLAYVGNAVVCSVMEIGSKLVCEATLDDTGWKESEPITALQEGGNLNEAFGSFVQTWDKAHRLSAEFKLVVTDMRSFFHHFRLWLDQIELNISTQPPARQSEYEMDVMQRLKPVISPTLNNLFERFETAANQIEKDAIPEHRAFCHQQLHAFLLDSPFTHRIFSKPMGYAGDHEMIDMIIRNQYEGKSLFSKLLHSYILDQAPAISVRNRALHFMKRFVEEFNRVSRHRHTLQVCSLGCGPAREVENFIASYPQSDRVNFRLLDFSQETLDNTNKRLEKAKRKHARRTTIKLVRKSAQYLIKDNKPIAEESGYDLIYCSGLYDYLSDRICKQLDSYLYDQLLPGGALVVTNFDPSNPIRNMMEFIFDWFLIHRNSREMAELAPEQALADNCRVIADTTGCNVFLEARKPL